MEKFKKIKDALKEKGKKIITRKKTKQVRMRRETKIMREHVKREESLDFRLNKRAWENRRDEKERRQSCWNVFKQRKEREDNKVCEDGKRWWSEKKIIQWLPGDELDHLWKKISRKEIVGVEGFKKILWFSLEESTHIWRFLFGILASYKINGPKNTRRWTGIFNTFAENWVYFKHRCP